MIGLTEIGEIKKFEFYLPNFMGIITIFGTKSKIGKKIKYCLIEPNRKHIWQFRSKK